MKQQALAYHDFTWQAGYGALSLGQSQLDALISYIDRQEEHHRKRTFKEELVEFLKRYGVDYDERVHLGLNKTMSRPFRACADGVGSRPRALPWAGMSRPCGAEARNLHGRWFGWRKSLTLAVPSKNLYANDLTIGFRKIFSKNQDSG